MGPESLTLDYFFRFTLLQEVEMVVRMTLAMIFGAIIGFERRYAGRPAGIRTLSMVSVGAALFTIVSIYGFSFSDTSRVAAQVVTGIGFLGAGIIFRTGDNVRGLTTAATIWMTAAVGMAVGSGMYVVSGFVTIMAIVILQVFPARRDGS